MENIKGEICGHLRTHCNRGGRMDSFLQLIVRGFASGLGRKVAFVLVGLCVAGITTCAKAAGTVPEIPSFTYRIMWGGNDTGEQSSAGAACSSARDIAAAGVPQWSVVTTGCTETQWSLRVTCVTAGACGGHSVGYYTDDVLSINKTGLGVCPGNSTGPVSALCTCNAGYEPGSGGTSCVGATSGCAAVLAGMSGTYYASGGTGGLHVCVAGCSMRGSISGRDGSGQYTAGPFTYNGVACSGSGSESPPAANPETSPTPLKPGNCPGTINGTAVPGGVPCSGGTEAGGTAPTPNTPASGGGPGTGTGGLVPGATTTCNTTGTCTTTIPQGGGGGGAGGGTGGTCTDPAGCNVTTSKDEFCAVNKGSPLCKDQTGGSFSGSCEGTFVAESEDAVVNAMAREQHRRNCQLMDTTTAISTIGTNAATGVNPADHPKNAVETSVISLSSQLSSVPLFGSSGACPADVSFTHAGYSFALPFSMLCPYLQLLGAAFMACCYLAAGFIVFGRNS